MYPRYGSGKGRKARGDSAGKAVCGSQKRSAGRTLYILDEPTTGLHISDVQRLIQVLQALVDEGNTVAVIEHNMEIIKEADYIIDLGPEGGDEGGRVVAAGSPVELLAHPNGSYTARYLRKYVNEN
jgi:excinuclease ABC subunit A